MDLEAWSKGLPDESPMRSSSETLRDLLRVTREVKLSETMKSVCGKVTNICVKKIEEKRE